MFKLCLWIAALALAGMAVGGFLMMDPPLMTQETSEKAREWLIIIFSIAGAGVLIFTPKKQ